MQSVETAKLRRRRQISAVAVQLFQERGFAAVTIADVARAAGVAKMTVTNHFPRKEDLLLDQLDEQVLAVQQLLRERPVGTSVLQTLEQYALDLLARGEPLAGLTTSPTFWAIIAASPTLLARLNEHFRQLGTAISAQLVTEGRAQTEAELTGQLLGTALGEVHLTALRQPVTPETLPAVVERQRVVITQAFALLRHGLTI